MINWIKDNFGLRNVLVLSLTILVIVGAIKGPSWYKQILRSQYKGSVEAQVTNIVAQEASFQHYNGMNTKILGYDISYFYEVEMENLSNTEFIKPNKDIKLLFDEFNSGKACQIGIRYSLESPVKSFITKLNLGRETNL